MAEPQTPATSQAGGTGDTSALAATHTTPDALAADGQETISLEDARKLRSEAVNLRKRLKGYEDQEEAAKQAALSEVQKANKLVADAQAKILQQQKQLVAAEVKIAAQAKGIIDPELASLAIMDKLEYGDDGMPTNLDKALDDLVKNKPYLKAAEPGITQSPARTAPATGANNPGRSNVTQPGALAPGKMTFHDLTWKS